MRLAISKTRLFIVFTGQRLSFVELPRNLFLILAASVSPAGRKEESVRSLFEFRHLLYLQNGKVSACKMKRIITVISFIVLCLQLTAQSLPPVKKTEENRNRGKIGNTYTGTSGKLLDTKGNTVGFDALPTQIGNYDDKKMKAIEKRFEDRKWEDEKLAWDAASGLDTSDAYRKYLARFPGGAHVPQAKKRLTDLSVNDIFKGSHNTLPAIERTEPDDFSETSTIVIENVTGMMLTVMFSGVDSRTVTIAPDSRESVTIKNGSYRIAASVPAPSIQPFAGNGCFNGGRYDTGFCIVRGTR